MGIFFLQIRYTMYFSQKIEYCWLKFCECGCTAWSTTLQFVELVEPLSNNNNTSSIKTNVSMDWQKKGVHIWIQSGIMTIINTFKQSALLSWTSDDFHTKLLIRGFISNVGHFLLLFYQEQIQIHAICLTLKHCCSNIQKEERF